MHTNESVMHIPMGGSVCIFSLLKYIELCIMGGVSDYQLVLFIESHMYN